MRNDKNLVSLLIVIIILVVVVVLYWDYQQRRIFEQLQTRAQVDVVEEWGPGSQQQIQEALQVRPAAFTKQVSYKNIIARVAPSVVSVNIDNSIFNNAAQQAQVRPIALTKTPNVSSFTVTPGGFWLCPNCCTSMPCRRAAIASLNCPNCGIQMTRTNPSWYSPGRPQTQANPIQSRPAGQSLDSGAAAQYVWGGPKDMAVDYLTCPNCRTKVPGQRGVQPFMINCPCCGVQMVRDVALRTSPIQPQQPQNTWAGPMGEPFSYLTCPNCRTKIPGQRGVPAFMINCPSCGVQMVRDVALRLSPIQPMANQQFQNAWAGPKGGAVDYLTCPNCRTKVRGQRGVQPFMINCPSCGVQMVRDVALRTSPIQAMAQTPAVQQGRQFQNTWAGPKGEPVGYLTCPNCRTKVPGQRGVQPFMINCPSCGVQMVRDVALRSGPIGQQWQQPAQQQFDTKQFQAAGKGGSGVIVNSQGYVLTNHHVIHGAKKITVTVYTGQASKAYQAELIDEAPELDFAILKIAGNGEVFTPAPIGNSSRVSVGDEVLAMGSPFGLSQTTTFGIVSNTRRTMTVGKQTFTDFIQTDAPINPGSSGGALVNIKGEVIGINTAIYSPTRAFSGVGFARPIDSAIAAFPDFIEAAGAKAAAVAFQRGTGLNPWCPPGGLMRQVANTTPQPIQRGQGLYPWCPPGGRMRQAAIVQSNQPWLGIRTSPVSQQARESLSLPMARGVVVTEVFTGSACQAAGVNAGDVIVRVDNRSLKDEGMLADLLASKSIGDKMKLSVYRDGKKSNLRMRLGPRPTGIPAQPVGFMESFALPGAPETQILPGM